MIELTSPTTEHVDRGDEMRIYALLRVAEYVIFDPWTSKLEVFDLDGATRTYRSRMPDESGRFASRVTGLTLGVAVGTYHGVEAPWLRWLTREGVVVQTGRECAAAERARADAETARADAETARADAAAARIAELESALARSESSG